MASACCGVVKVGDLVEFGHQTNLIVWDAERKVEHFVRIAHFESEAEDIGFIAPTPTVPELEEADPHVFVMLENLKPVRPGVDGVVKSAAAGGVEVMQEVDVAGYRAATLKASDAEKLADWMSENGYSTTDSVEEWTDFYIQKGWYLTAFKVVEDEFGEIETGAVRMSFETERPFNPYYVPVDNRGGNSGLRLYFLAEGVVEGKVGGTDAWKDPQWTTAVDSRKREDIATALDLNVDQLPAQMTLTTFQDYSFPNAAADDLYFEVRPAGASPLTMGLVVGGILVLGGGLYTLMRRRTPAA